MLEQIADLLVIYVWAITALFTLGYGALFCWWQTPGGRSVFLLFVSLTLVMSLVITAIWLPDLLGGNRELVRVLSYTLIAATVTNMLSVLVTRWVRRHDVVLGVAPRSKPTLDNENEPRA